MSDRPVGIQSWVPRDWRAKNAAAFHTSPHEPRATVGPADPDAAYDGNDGTDNVADVLAAHGDRLDVHAGTLADHGGRLDRLEDGGE
jgi:hypothetical protein